MIARPFGRKPRHLGWRIALGAAAAIFSCGLAHAQGDVRQPVTDLCAALHSPGGSFVQRYNEFAPVIDRDFNLNEILQTSVGLRWPSMDAASRDNLFKVFREFTVASYASNFQGGGTRCDVLPQTRAAGADTIIESRLMPNGGDPVRIDYVIRGGRIVDVLLNGSISRVAVQRSDFRSLLSSGGAGPLIDSLRQKVADLSGGSMRP
jgi:phospholipid transport system substrate-binding protein